MLKRQNVKTSKGQNVKTSRTEDGNGNVSEFYTPTPVFVPLNSVRNKHFNCHTGKVLTRVYAKIYIYGQNIFFV